MEKWEKNQPEVKINKYGENTDVVFLPNELKMLNLIAELIVNISIRESYEEGNKVSAL